MGFQEDKIDEFLNHFNTNKNNIRDFEGCEFLELYRDKNEQHIFFTYSYWQSENHLSTYRSSDLFKLVWSKTKPLFSQKPEAWSVEKLESLK